tara:strand:- start:1181 stop:2302 length:1122 start_codon:yes stop_codon:yes gene_type:complete
MPNFKPKNQKVIKVTSVKNDTLDMKHNDILCKFKKECDEIVPNNEKRIEHLKNKLKEKKNTKNKLDIHDQIQNLRKKNKDIMQYQKNYYLNNSKYIFEYFEKKKNVSEGINKTKVVDNFFTKSSNTTIKHNSNENISKYFSNIDDKYIDIDKCIQQSNICPNCKKGELIPVEYEGVLICNNDMCAKQLRYLIENEKPSYKEPPKEVCFYAYKRINHFREILAQFQAKETTQIPDEIIENIKLQIQKERTNIADLNNKQAKDILKKLGYNKFYEHIPFIKDKLGIKPPVMTPELEDKLCNLFMDIQHPYAKYCPGDRVNFLNYYYTIYKLCELLDEEEFLPYFPMLKDREKRIEQDEIWKKICAELGWQFIPTI